MLGRHRREFSLIVATAAIAAVLAVVAPDFFSFANQRDLMLANMPVLIVSLGMVLVILTGQIDISVGSQFAICSVAAGVFARMGLPMPLAGAAACLIGALMGGVNGALVAWVRIPSIVVTLATMVALRDGLRWVTQGAWVQDLPPGFQWFGQSQGTSEAITAGCAAALAVGMNWGLRHLAAGRVVYATGSSPDAARLAGINPRLVVFAVFVVTGALTGFAAVFNAVRFLQIPSNAGIGLELKVIAAAVVGGVAIAGGRGTIGGTLLGVLLLGLIGPALTFLGFSAYWERAIEGGIILAAVSLDAVRVHSRRDAARGGSGKGAPRGDSGKGAPRGDSGNDAARSDSGNDAARGGSGNDAARGDSGNDAARGDSGNDAARGGSGKDAARGDSSKDAMRGDSSKDAMRGGEGNNAQPA